MIKLELRPVNDNLPTCWVGFIEMLNQETDVVIDQYGYTIGTINDYLKPYEATFVEERCSACDHSYLLFNNEEDIVVFKLRFGV